MRGRTNVGGGSSFFVEGNTINGIVDEKDGIVSGDFVEKVITEKELNFFESLSINSAKISQNFSLGNGSFCTFIEPTNSTTSNIKIWFYRIENNEMVDEGAYNIEIPDFPVSYFKVAQITENTFIFAGTVSIGLSYYHYYYIITINGKTIEINYCGERALEDSNNRAVFGIEKLANNKFVTICGYNTNSGGIGVYISTLSENMLSFGEIYYTSEVYEGISIYEDGYIALFSHDTLGSTTVYPSRLFKVEENEVSLVKTFQVASGSGAISSVMYIGEGRTLIAGKANSTTISGQILTLTEKISSMSAILTLAESPLVPNEIFLYQTWGRIFIVAGKKTNHSASAYYSSEQQYAAGIWNPESGNGIELVEIFSGNNTSSIQCTFYWYICGFCMDTQNLAISVLSTRSTSSSATFFKELGFRISDYSIESLEEKMKFRKYISKIDGVSKQSGANGEIIEVYVPK